MNPVNFRKLIAAIVDRAIDDLQSTDLKLSTVETDRAMTFILGEDCEAWCLELGIDYEAVKEKAAALYRRFLEKTDTDSGAGRTFVSKHRRRLRIHFFIRFQPPFFLIFSTALLGNG
jgi:hypothetical protein